MRSRAPQLAAVALELDVDPDQSVIARALGAFDESVQRIIGFGPKDVRRDELQVSTRQGVVNASVVRCVLVASFAGFGGTGILEPRMFEELVDRRLAVG